MQYLVNCTLQTEEIERNSAKMAENCKKRVNRSRSRLIFEWTRPFLDMKFCKEIRKRQGFPNLTSVFHLYFYVFYKKLKTVKNSDFSNVVARYGATRFFTENPAVLGNFVHAPLSSFQKAKKSIDGKYHNFWRTRGRAVPQNGYMLNFNWSWEL